MRIAVCTRALPLAALLFGAALPAADGPIRRLTVDPDARRVELFAAQDEGLVTVKVLPRDEFQATISVTNTTQQPLTVEVPKAFACVHVQKQFGPFAQGTGTTPFGPTSLAANSAQGRGAQATAGQAFPFQQNNGNGTGNFPGNVFGTIFSIPPEKTVQVQLQSVCLEHGKPNPTQRMTYEIRRLDQYTDNAALIRLLESADFRRTDRAAIQAAAWHLANGLTFEQLAGEMIGPNPTDSLFGSTHLQQARQLVAAAETNAAATPPATPASATRRAR